MKRSRVLLAAFVALLLPFAALAEGTYAGRTGTGAVVLVTESTIPATGQANLTYRITNATNSSDCASGTPGTARADCRWNGSTYEPIGVATSGLTNPLVSNLAGASFDITGVDEILSNSVNQMVYPGSSATLINAAIQACGVGSDVENEGCGAVLPDGKIPIDATIRLGGLTLGTMQNAIQLHGRGAGIVNSNGKHLAGTTLYWTGAAGGTMMEVSGMGHVVDGIQLSGLSCVDKFSAGGPPQTTGSPDTKCDSDGSTTQVKAGWGIVQSGDNSASAVTGKNRYQNLVITGILDTTDPAAGWGFAFGRGPGDLGQNDHTILENVRFVGNRHCLTQNDTQAIANEVRLMDCSSSTESPSIQINRGGIAFMGGFMGSHVANDTGFSIDYCATEWTIERVSFEVQGTGDYRALASSNNYGGSCGYGNTYQSRFQNNRVQFQADASTTHYLIDWSASASLLISGNEWMSNNANALRRGKFNFPNPGTNDRYITMIGNNTGWNNGYDRTDPVMTVTSAGGARNDIVRIDRGQVELTTKDGTVAIARDATSAFADNNGNRVYDAGTDLRLSPAGLGDVFTVGSCGGPDCFVTTTSSALSPGIFSISSISALLDEDKSSTTDGLRLYHVNASDTEELYFNAREDGTLFLGSTGAQNGAIGLRGATSGTITLAPPSGALGTPTVTLPLGGTLATLGGTETLSAKTLTTPKLTGAIDWNDVLVDDDDCAGQQGQGWYDTTDNRFEWCNANSGVPDVLGAGGGGATAFDDLTDVVITTPATGAGLKYNGSAWVNGPLDLADSDAVSGVLPAANVSTAIVAANYLPLAGGSISGNVNLGSGVTLNVQTGASVSSSGGSIIATAMAGSATIDDNDVQVSAIDGGTGGEIEDGTLTAADLAPASLTAADAAADLATQAELDALTLPATGQTDNRLVKTLNTAGDIEATGITVDDSNNVSGVGNITVTGTLAAPVLSASQPTGTNVPTLIFTEGATNGINTVTIQGPAGGFAADRSCTLQDDSTPLDNCVSGGVGGGAPTDAQYFVGAANGTLSAEVVAGTGVATAFQVNVGSAGAFVTNGGALGTPSSGNASNLTNIPAANVTGNLDLATGTIRGAVSVEATTSTTHSLTAARGQWLFADEAGTTTISLPALSAGASVCVYPQTDQQVHIDPNTTQVIVLNGTALTGGNKISSPAAGGNAGNFACLLSNGTNWYVLGKAGTWTDGG